MPRPLISICVPTLNRADVITKMLDSILLNPAYSPDKIEIVISDNASTDNTEEVIHHYQEKYQGIVYHRNSSNIGMMGNFQKVLELGNGEFLKYNNDYSIFTSHGLKDLIECVEKNKKEKPVLYFNNNVKHPLKTTVLNSIDSVVENQNAHMSWLGCYGYWREDFNTIEDKERMFHTLFCQVDWFLRILQKKKKCVVCATDFTYRESFEKKQGGYNFIKIQVGGYSEIFKPYVKIGELRKATYDKMMRRLYNVMFYWLVKFYKTKDQRYNYDTKGSIAYLFQFYKGYYWCYTDPVKFILKAITNKIFK